MKYRFKSINADVVIKFAALIFLPIAASTSMSLSGGGGNINLRERGLSVSVNSEGTVKLFKNSSLLWERETDCLDGSGTFGQVPAIFGDWLVLSCNGELSHGFDMYFLKDGKFYAHISGNYFFKYNQNFYYIEIPKYDFFDNGGKKVLQNIGLRYAKLNVFKMNQAGFTDSSFKLIAPNFENPNLIKCQRNHPDGIIDYVPIAIINNQLELTTLPFCNYRQRVTLSDK